MSTSEVRQQRSDLPALLWFATAALALLALGVALVSLVTDGGGGGGSSKSAGKTTAGELHKVDVSLQDLTISPKSLSINAGDSIEFTVTNKGEQPHDLQVGEAKTEMLDPGASATLMVGPLTESIEAICTVAGHKDAGMVMAIEVKGGGDTQTAAASGGSDTAGTNDGFATIDFTKAADDGFVARDPKLAPAPNTTVHNIELHATDEMIEVAPGVKQLLWTFGGTVPGTTLRGKVGDVFNVKLFNDGTIDHSIDFHASKVAWNDEMRSIHPGESLDYSFTANHAGIFMYHCGTVPALHHIGNGMYGAIIIDPPDLPVVDHEFLIVQSELYLGPEGKEGDLKKMQNTAWDAIVFNGYVNQYKDRPIRVEPGQRVRVWVVDDGPSENSAFHIVGTIFDTVWKEGTFLLRPDARRGGSQVLDLQPAQGGFVEFTFAEAGLYPIVTHKFANVGKGALGLFQAGEVETTTAGGH